MAISPRPPKGGVGEGEGTLVLVVFVENVLARFNWLPRIHPRRPHLESNMHIFKIFKKSQLVDAMLDFCDFDGI